MKGNIAKVMRDLDGALALLNVIRTSGTLEEPESGKVEKAVYVIGKVQELLRGVWKSMEKPKEANNEGRENMATKNTDERIVIQRGEGVEPLVLIHFMDDRYINEKYKFCGSGFLYDKYGTLVGSWDGERRCGECENDECLFYDEDDDDEDGME